MFARAGFNHALALGWGPLRRQGPVGKTNKNPHQRPGETQMVVKGPESKGEKRAPLVGE